MPVYHIILNAYGSWNADNLGGWHQHGKRSTLAPCEKIALYRRKIQKHPTLLFPVEYFSDLSALIRDISTRRNWRCHASAITPSHIHIVCSWRVLDILPLSAQSTYKRVLGWKLAKLTSIRNRRWFSDGGIPVPVTDQAHLDYLTGEYLPDQGGLFYREP